MSEIDYFNEMPDPDLLEDKLWRLSNLYYIIDKDGNQIKFNLNWAQREIIDNYWYQMLILKARQLGCTTFFSINFLDDCFWYDNINAGILADKKDNAEAIFKKKVKYAYDKMPKWTRHFNEATNDRVGELAFKNGSNYTVSTGFRSGTFQRLLISEFGKICAQRPDVAREIVTGSLNAVSRDQTVVIESTAEGREGYFYDFAKDAEALALSGKELSPMQRKFIFFPWFKEPGYREESKEIIISKETEEYITGIELECRVKIDDSQRRWYELKSKDMQDSMKQEYPSTPSEAFEASNEGLYYGKQISKLRSEGHICRVPYQEGQPVHTAFDIGFHDFTSIWFFQLAPGGQIQVIDFYQFNGEGAKYYVDYLKSRGYTYGTHILPHDAMHNDAGSGTNWLSIFESLTKERCHVLNIKECDPLNGIQCVRSILGRCYFDEQKCKKGVSHLEAYKKEWNDKLGTYRSTPLHNADSHASDAFRYLAIALDLGYVGGKYLSAEKVKEMRRAHGYK